MFQRVWKNWLLLICIVFVSLIAEPRVFGSLKLCGPESLYVALCALKPDQAPSSFADFRRAIPSATEQGYSMATLREIAVEFGLHAELLRLSTDELLEYVQHNLAILRFSQDGGHHFVLCPGAEGQDFQLFDPERRQRMISRKSLESRWTGECLVLSIGPPKLEYRWSSRWLVWWTLGVLSVPAVFLLLRYREKVALLLIVACGICGSCNRSSPIEPRSDAIPTLTVVGPSTVDLGTVKEGQQMSASFLLRNDSDSDIAVDRIQTSCSCAHATASCSIVPPGETCEVQLYVDPVQSSALKASVSITSGNSVARLEANWQFGDKLRPSLSEFPILEVSVGQSIVSSFELKGNAADSAIVESVMAGSIPGIQHLATLKAGKVRLELEVSDSVNPGLHYGFVGIAANRNSETSLRIPWTLRVRAPLSISPSELFFFAADRPGFFSAQLVIESELESELQELTIEPIPEDLSSFAASVEMLSDHVRIIDLVLSETALEQLDGVQLSTGSGYTRVLDLRR